MKTVALSLSIYTTGQKMDRMLWSIDFFSAFALPAGGASDFGLFFHIFVHFYKLDQAIKDRLRTTVSQHCISRAGQ